MSKSAEKGEASIRSDEGMSLVTVLLIGLVCSLWIAGLMGSVMPSYRKVTGARSDFTQRSVAEAALDWAVQDLNSPAPTINSGQQLEATTVTPIPAAILQTANVPQINGTITVITRQPQQPSANGGSYLYEQQSNYYPDPAINNGVNNPLWRVVEARVNLGNRIKRIRAIMKPTVNQVTINGAMTVGGAGDLGPNTDFDSYDSTIANSTDPSGCDIKINGILNIGNASLGGSVVSYYNGPQTNGILATAKGTVRGKARANKAIDPNVTAQGRAPQGWVNPDNPLESYWDYKQRTDPGQGSGHKWNHASTKLGGQTMTPLTIPPAPPHPTGARQIPPIESTQTISSGDYFTNRIAIRGSSKLIVKGTSTAPVRIWVEGTGSVVSVSGGGAVNEAGQPVALQIFYNGNGSVNITGQSEFRGIVYAPNAKTNISGNGQFFGALVTNDLSFNGGGNRGGFHFDRSLLNMRLNSQVTRFTVVSWEEVPEGAP